MYKVMASCIVSFLDPCFENIIKLTPSYAANYVISEYSRITQLERIISCCWIIFPPYDKFKIFVAKRYFHE